MKSVVWFDDGKLPNVADQHARQVIGLLRGERPPRLVNPDAWPRFAQRFDRIFGGRVWIGALE